MKIPITRRNFLVASGLTAVSSRRILGANERIRLGAIGTGDRGGYLMRQLNEAGGIEWVSVCDVWDKRRDRAAEIAGGGVTKDADYRRLLDRKDIDGVVIATCDHWHAQQTIDACHAGKDVYVEKPLTQNPLEGPAIHKAVQDTRRVVQVGMQQRSMANFIEAKEKFFDSGLIGNVHMVRTLWNANRGYLTPVPAGMEQKPAGLDWDAWLGCLPRISWDPRRYFNRFAYWDVSCGGQTGGLLVHMIDVVHWFLNLKYPSSAVCLGGIYQYNDGRDTPDNLNAILEYPQKLTVSFEASLTDLIQQGSADIVFLGTGGRLSIFRAGYRFLPSEANQSVGEIVGGKAAQTTHLTHWLQCMRNRQQPNADVTAGHYSAMACHMANLAYKQQQRVSWRKEWEL